MNREVILNYLRKPSLLAGASLSDLEQLTADFPYASITHLLYIKALSEQKSIHYHNRLKITAAHVSDRSILYYLLNSDPTAHTNTLTPNATTLTPQKQEPGREAKPLTPAAVPEEPPQGLDALLLQVKALASRNIPALDDIDIRLSQLDIEHQKRVEDIARAYLALREITLSSHLPEPEEEKIEEPAIEPPCEETQPDPINEVQPSLLPTEPKHITKKADLIEKFIETAPSMPKNKKDFFSPSNMAHSSTVDKEDLVSETLALIHLKQGNIQKALKIYQRLCLIIPEKSTYFAARIEEIKKENNLL